MRYLLLTYIRKANGQVDEAMEVTNHLRMKDIQIANVILDFKKLQVVKASMGDSVVPKDWDKIVSYYYEHYAATIERLFAENGWEVIKPEPEKTDSESTEETQMEESES
jgi:hypothetical protein